MRVMAVLQNQWFHNPAQAQRIIDALGSRAERRDFDRQMLFAGCLTGRRLRAAFGDQVDAWEWTNASPRLGGYAAARFPADPAHIRAELADIGPDLVLAFGRVATDAMERLWTGRLIVGPHPVARHPINAPAELRRMAEALRSLSADG